VTSSRSAVSHADTETSALTGPAIFSRVLGALESSTVRSA
jgi:hypothetical protein